MSCFFRVIFPHLTSSYYITLYFTNHSPKYYHYLLYNFVSYSFYLFILPLFLCITNKSLRSSRTSSSYFVDYYFFNILLPPYTWHLTGQQEWQVAEVLRFCKKQKKKNIFLSQNTIFNILLNQRITPDQLWKNNCLLVNNRLVS